MIASHDFLVRLFDLLLGPLDDWTPTTGLWVMSALSGVAVLLVFRWTSRPVAIRAARRRAQAELLAVRLYRDQPRVVLRAQASFLAALGRYLGHVLVPFAALVLPFGLLCAQLDARYGSRALAPGERALVTASGTDVMLESASLQSTEGIAIEAGPVRIPERDEMSWRIAATAPGHRSLTLLISGRRVSKEVVVATVARGASPRRMVAGVSSFFLAPAEAAIGDVPDVRSIEILYPPLEIDLLGWKAGWLTVFLLVSVAVALALRRRLGVEF